MKPQSLAALLILACILVAVLVTSTNVAKNNATIANLDSSQSSASLPRRSGDTFVDSDTHARNQVPSADPADGQAVEVQVHDRFDARRIDSARMKTASGQAAVEIQSTAGKFAVPVLWSTADQLIIEAERYLARAISHDDWKALVRQRQEGEVIIVELISLGSLVVMAKDHAGKAVSGVVVSVRPHSVVPKKIPYGWFSLNGGIGTSSVAQPRLPGGDTNADGRVELPSLPTEEDLLIKWRGSVQPGEKACRIEGETRSALVEIVVHRGVRVYGRFVNRDGVPLEQTVMRVRLDGARERFEVLLQGNGEFAFEGIPAGAARLAPLFPDAQVFPLEVGEEDIDLGDIQLIPAPARITGRVVAPESASLVLMVMGERGDRREIYMVRPTTFDIMVAEGPLHLAVRRNGGEIVKQLECVAPVSDLLIEVESLDGSIRFGVADGQTPSNVFVERSREGGHRFGRRLDDPVLVRVADRAGPGLKCTPQGNDYYEVNGIEPGSYTFHVTTATAAGCSIADVKVLRGTVTDLGPISCARSTVTLGGDSATGYIVFPLVGERTSIKPGDATEIPSGTVYWMPDRIGAGTATVSGKTLAPGEGLELPTLERGGRVEGYAIAAFPAMIELRPDGYGAGVPERAMKRLLLGESGAFVFEDVEPGPCAICLLAIEGGPHVEVPVVVYAGETSRVNLQIGSDSLSFDFKRNGEAVTDATFVDLFAAEDGTRYRGRAGAGKCYAPIIASGTYLVAVTAPSIGYIGEGLPEPAAFGQLIVPSGGDQSVEAYAGTIDVELAPTSMRPPVAAVTAWNGKKIRVWGIAVPLLARERTGAGLYRFLSVPPDADIELVWTGPHGQEQRRTVEIRGGVPSRVVLE